MSARLKRLRTRSAALGALFTSVAVLAVTGVRAWRVEPLPGPVAATPHRVTLAARTLLDSGSVTEVVDRIVDASPFRPDRVPSEVQYRLAVATPATVDRPAPPRLFVPQIRLHGTAATGSGGGLAALSVNGRPAQLVAVGQSLEGMQLVRVQQGSATLRRTDTTVVLNLPGASRPQ